MTISFNFHIEIYELYDVNQTKNHNFLFAFQKNLIKKPTPDHSPWLVAHQCCLPVPSQKRRRQSKNGTCSKKL